jgi:hypothetical protein
MSDTRVAVRSGGFGDGGASTLPPVPSLASLITLDALTDLKELLQRHDVRGTLIGISAIETLLLAELVEHVKCIGKDHKRLVDYVTPASGAAPPATPPSGSPSGDAGPGGTGGATGAPSQVTASASPPPSGVAAGRAPSQFVTDFGEMLTPVVKMPVEQLRTTVDSQGKAIDKGAVGISELQVAHTASDARLRGLETNFYRLEAAHRGLSDRVAEMDFELGESAEATEALGEAVREAGSPVIVVVEEGEEADPGGPVRKTRARPMRQGATNVRKAQARKKK